MYDRKEYLKPAPVNLTEASAQPSHSHSVSNHKYSFRSWKNQISFLHLKLARLQVRQVGLRRFMLFGLWVNGNSPSHALYTVFHLVFGRLAG